jgi:hypothetical protein
VTEESANQQEYSFRAFFAVAVVFVLAAPVFWMRTEVHNGSLETAFENADLYQEILPAYEYGFGRVRNGELPLWNPKQMCGTPFQANPASALFQPLNLIFAMFPTERAMAIHAFAALSLMGIFFVMFLRSLGLGYITSAIGGIAYAFCGASAAAVSRPAMANVLVWLPVALWGLRTYFKSYRMSAIVVTGMAGALILLSGATGLALTVLLAVAAYAIYLAILPGRPAMPRTEKPPYLRRFEALALAGAITLSVSAVQWIPALFWMATLDQPLRALFSPAIAGTVPNSLQETLAQLLVPKPAALPRITYLGALPLLAVPAAFFLPKSRGDILFFLISGLAFLLLGTRLSWPSFPSGYFVYPGIVSITVVSAAGFDRLIQSGGIRQAQRPWLPAFVVLAAAGALFYVAGAAPRGRIVAFIALLAASLLLRKRWMLISIAVVFALLVFSDLTAANRNMYRHPIQSGNAMNAYIKTIQTAEEQALDARVLVSSVYPDNSLPANLGMLYPSIYGADGLVPVTREQAVWWRRLAGPESTAAGRSTAGMGVSVEAASPKLINYMAARAIIAGPESPMYAGQWLHEGPALREIRTEELPRLFLNDSALPRAAWVPSWRMSEGITGAANELSRPEHDGRAVCAVDHDSPGLNALTGLLPNQAPANPETPQQNISATCVIAEDAPERVAMNVSSPQPGITVLADSYDRWWRAWVDGAPTPVLRVNGLFRGIPLPAGEHAVVFEYRPMPFYAGVIISLAALAALAFSGVAAFLRRG